MKGPGKLIPVFFLSLLQANLSGQVEWPGAASAALGGSFVCRQDYMCSSQNQAGLGFAEHSSISIQHGRPFLIRELGITSLSGQFRTGKGALGISFATTGLKGLRQSSFWLACGLKLHPRVSAGAGLHFWNTSIREQAFFAPGIGFSLGLQVRIRDRWKLGVRLNDPAAWSQPPEAFADESMSLETGAACSIFNVGQLFAELHIKPGMPIILCGGAEWSLNRQIVFRTGISSGPYTFSWGISFRFKRCVADFSFRYRSQTGLSPLSALSYEW
jgi:hypothetical protein